MSPVNSTPRDSSSARAAATSSTWSAIPVAGLNSAVNAYNQGAGSLDARVLPQLRRLEDAGAGSEKPVPQITGLDTPAKLIVAPELAQAPDADTADRSPAAA